MPDKSLGLIPVPERTIEHDFALLARFQEFSAELLRVALIGISAIGYAVSRIFFPETKAAGVPIDPVVKGLVIAALVSLAVSAAAALVHRYYAADSMSWHLQAMRRYERHSGTDVERADSEFRARHRRFRISSGAIASSACALGVGAALLVAAIVLAIP